MYKIDKLIGCSSRIYWYHFGNWKRRKNLPSEMTTESNKKKWEENSNPNSNYSNEIEGCQCTCDAKKVIYFDYRLTPSRTNFITSPIVSIILINSDFKSFTDILVCVFLVVSLRFNHLFRLSFYDFGIG